MSASRRLGVALALVGATSVAPACGVSGLAFVEDERVEIITPDDRDEVALPVTIRWRSEVPRRADGGPYWAVFVDREPVRPGQSLRAVLDDSCNRDRSCSVTSALRDRFVFLTDGTSVVLEVLPEQGSDERKSSREQHEVVLVPVDADGFRIGESAYSVEFRVEEP